MLCKYYTNVLYLHYQYKALKFTDLVSMNYASYVTQDNA